MNQIKRKATSLLKVVLIAALFMNVGCSDENEVEKVADKFLTHLNNFEFKEAKEYCDDKTASMLGMLEGFSAMAKDQKADKATFKITGSEVKDDNATVNYTQTSGKETKEEVLNLKKIDGKWKVSMNKEDANKESGAAPAGDMEEVTPVDDATIMEDTITNDMDMEMAEPIN